MKNKKILIVEDELITAENIRVCLSDAGYEVTGMFSTAEEALGSLERIRPDLVMMDIRLGGKMDGIEAAELVLQRYDLPVIYLTSYADDEVIRRAASTESYGYIIKPFQEAELISNIEMAVFKHGAAQRLKESERKFRVLIEKSSACVFIIRNDRFLYANPSAQAIAGYTLEELGRINPSDLVHPDFRDVVREKLESIIRGGEDGRHFGAKIVAKNGAEHWMDMQAAMINYDGISAQLIEAVDVSAIKHSEEMLHRTNIRLRRALDGSVGAMAFTLETRDPYTAGHQRRVAELSFAIAASMGLEADAAEGVRIAAAIHDLGKISIPSEILSKPTKLSEIEFSLIKIHSQAGYDILKNIDFPWPIAEIVYQHHEKMDGSGYPRGLRGEALLVQSRILVVADVVEAMASHRPYRPALGLECALEEIAKNRGRLYDGDVVDACMDCFKNKGFEFK